MKRNFSQNISGTFELIDYILLVPATMGLLLSFVTSTFFPAVICMYLTGCLLLAGYIFHSRGKLNHSLSIALWLGTIIYNLFLAAGILYFIVWDFKTSEEFFSSDMILRLLAALGYLTAVVLAGWGLKCDITGRQKYL